MDPNLLATIVTVFGGGLVAVIIWLVKRGKPGLAASDPENPEEVVKAVASGKTATYGPEAFVAMATMLTKQGERITALERHEQRYLERISALENWGRWSAGDPPREPPPWLNDPRGEF